MRILIALSLATLALAGCTEEPAAPDVQVAETPEAIVRAPTYVNETGTTTGLSVDPGPTLIGGVQVHTFEVVAGTGRLDANLAWTSPVFALQMTVLKTDGATTSSSSSEANHLRISITDPEPGNYEARVSTPLGVAVDYQLSIRMAPDASASAFLAADAVIPPGQFFEINMQNELGSVLHWDWSATSASAFNLHTHFDGETEYVVEETTDAHADRYEVVRTGGHSLMWENPGSTPQTVSYRVWGAFEVDSYFPPR